MEITVEILERELCKDKKRRPTKIKDNWQIFPSRIRGVDFVGYRFFGKYILLRKRTCNRMKRKLLWIRINKVDKNQLLNYGEWCCCNSYVGWMIYCNHFRIYEKYIQPIIKWLTRYYYYIIKRNRDRLDKYYRKLIGKNLFLCNIWVRNFNL